MKTTFLLYAQYESAVVPLSQIAEDYLGTSPAQAARLAAANDIPFPVFRLRNSNKSPWMVKIDDLAEYIDRTAAQARKHLVSTGGGNYSARQ